MTARLDFGEQTGEILQDIFFQNWENQVAQKRLCIEPKEIRKDTL